MFGCLRKIISSIIFIFAVVGFFSLGGQKFVANKFNEYFNPSQDKVIQNAEKMADFSKVLPSYKVEKAVDVLGAKAVITSVKNNNQKMIIVDPGWAFKLTKNDLNSGVIDKKLKELAKISVNQPIKITDFKIQEKSFFMIKDQKVPYVKVKLNLVGVPYKNMEGIIGVAESGTFSQKILISVNEEKKYNKKLAEDFFKQVKLK